MQFSELLWDRNIYPHNEKKKTFAKCGVRTHAPYREPELKSGALDRSANLAYAANYDEVNYSAIIPNSDFNKHKRNTKKNQEKKIKI